MNTSFAHEESSMGLAAVERALHQLSDLTHEDVKTLAKNIVSSPAKLAAFQMLQKQIDEIVIN